MPRRLRLVVPEVPLHIIQRGNNRQDCFFSDSDYKVYLDILGQSLAKTSIKLHAYVLMSNHVHLLASPGDVDAPGDLMKALGERYVSHINRRYKRTGTLWQGRFRSCLVENQTYFLVCQRYIELNPVRADMVAHPAQHAWSSYHANAHGLADALITPHSVYQDLAPEPLSRQSAYRSLFDHALAASAIDEIRAATNGNYVFGSGHFSERISSLLGRPVSRKKPGRPNPRERHASSIVV